MAEQSLKLSYGMSRRFEPYLPPKMQGRTLLMLALRFTQRRMKMAAKNCLNAQPGIALTLPR